MTTPRAATAITTRNVNENAPVQASICGTECGETETRDVNKVEKAATAKEPTTCYEALFRDVTRLINPCGAAFITNAFKDIAYNAWPDPAKVMATIMVTVPMPDESVKSKNAPSPRSVIPIITSSFTLCTRSYIRPPICMSTILAMAGKIISSPVSKALNPFTCWR